MVRTTVLTSLVVMAIAGVGCNAPEADEGAAATTEELMSSCRPPLTAADVCDKAYTNAVDDPHINRSALVPTLRTDYEWKCYHECGGPPHVACVGLSHFDPRAGELNEDFSCGFPIYFARNTKNGAAGEHSISYRVFNHGNLLTHRIIHNNATDTYSRNADGTGNRTQGSWDARFDDVFVTPGDTSAATETITGLDFIQKTVPSGKLLVLDQGQLVAAPDGSFNIISGRWDMWDGYDAANARMCAALSGH